MQSLKSKIIITLIRNRHLFKFKLKPEVVDEKFDVKKFRDDTDRISEKMNKIPDDISIQNLTIGNMHGEYIIPNGARDDKVVMYIHGGGFISGSCLTHRGHVFKFAKSSGVKMLLFDYRLAPEFPFPAALDDCIQAYVWLLDQGYDSSNILIMGESAGGTLTLSTLITLRDKGYKLPSGAVSISPVTDLTCRAKSFETNAKKDIAPMGSWTTWTNFYIADNDPLNPLLSPMMADLKDLPPIMIQVGTHEIHLDDAKDFAEKASSSGVNVTLRVWEGMVHAFPVLSPLFDEAKRAMDEIGQYIAEKLNI